MLHSVSVISIYKFIICLRLWMWGRERIPGKGCWIIRWAPGLFGSMGCCTTCHRKTSISRSHTVWCLERWRVTTVSNTDVDPYMQFTIWDNSVLFSSFTLPQQLPPLCMSLYWIRHGDVLWADWSWKDLHDDRCHWELQTTRHHPSGHTGGMHIPYHFSLW